MYNIMIVECEFKIFNYNCSGHYSIVINSKEILKNEDILIFQGQHEPGKTNDDVKLFLISDCNMPQLPQNIGDPFKNIEVIQIFKSNLKTLTKFDLKQFENLKEIDLTGNDIEFLPGDLFEYTKKIKKIGLSSNKIKFIGPKLLDGFDYLEYVYLRSNDNIDCFYQPYFNRSITLEQLKEKIRTQCKPPMDEREMLKKYGRNPDEEKTKINQQNLTHNFHYDLKEFLQLDDFKDFTIKVADCEFKVHKLIFAVRSQTFAELIKNNPDASDIELQDIPVEVFECILSFIYTDELPETQNIHEIFAAAGKLKIRGLVELTSGILTSTIKNEKNLMTLYKIMCLAVKFDHEELKLKAFEEIKKQFPGRNLKDELANQPEKLKILINTKLMLEQQLEELEI